MNITGLDLRVGTWAASSLSKAPDKIISSDYATAKVFVPSYEKIKRPCIELLITNEYQRMWWKEKEDWDKMLLPAKAGSKKLMFRPIIKKRKQNGPTDNYRKKAQSKEKSKEKKKVKREENKKVEETNNSEN